MAKLNLLQDYNNGHYLFTGNIPFNEIYNKVRYTYRINPNVDPYGDDSMFDDDKKNIDLSNNEYQRRIDEDRIKEIKKFILNQIIHYYNKDGQVSVIFPTSMILATDFENDKRIFEDGEPIDVTSELNDCLIVDGQHRLYSMSSLYEEAKTTFFLSPEIPNSKIMKFIEEYKFNITLLVNFDIWEQAQVFATVNFNQKKVNKSLYYDIYGFYYGEKGNEFNELFLTHKLVQSLNSMERSPLKNFIKMLGRGPGFVSQAFMVEALLRHFSKRGIWYDRVNEDIKNDKRNFMYITYELIAYFDAIKETFNEYWPDNITDKKKSIICKTTGLGALILLLGHLHSKIDDEFKDIYFTNEYSSQLKALFKDKLHPLKKHEKELFSVSEKGKYAGSGGKGLQVSLYKRMIEILKDNNK